MKEMQCATGDQRYLSLVFINGGVGHFNVGLLLKFRYLTFNFGNLMVRICNSHMKIGEISHGLICIDFFLISQLHKNFMYNGAVLEENRSIKTDSEAFLCHFIGNVKYLAWPGPRSLAPGAKKLGLDLTVK